MSFLSRSVGGRSHFGATSPAGHIFIWNSPYTTHCKIVHLSRDIVFFGMSCNCIKFS